MTQKRFALIGLAGYIAPRHLRAIKDTGHDLVAALDPSDSVGIIDSYFPEADFFVEFERFDRHFDKLRRAGRPIDYVSICSPNYLHDSHIRFALRSGAHAICEKPLVLNPWNVEALTEIEAESDSKVHTVLQLRLHPSLQKLKAQIDANGDDRQYDIDLTYITSRGNWYAFSWKGDPSKSGGVATNIGIHFFDMLLWIFGPMKNSVVHATAKDMACGYLQLEKARVRWYLSLRKEDVPPDVLATGQRTFRSIKVDGEEVEFSGGFTDLHTDSYRQILAGGGFGLDQARPSVELAQSIRNATLQPGAVPVHPLFAGGTSND